MFCMQCGLKLASEAQFCNDCGHAIDSPMPSSQSEPIQSIPSAAASDASRIAAPTNVSNASSLINCITCSKNMSTLADRCPHCAAPNSWIHPQIKQFLADKDKTGISRPFTFHYNKTEILGETTKNRPQWVWLIAICFMPIFVGGGFIFAVISAAIGWLIIDLLFVKTYEFRADVAERVWKSNNDALWRPVRQLLQL